MGSEHHRGAPIPRRHSPHLFSPSVETQCLWLGLAPTPQRAFVIMAVRMSEYKSYMPQALFTEQQETVEDMDRREPGKRRSGTFFGRRRKRAVTFQGPMVPEPLTDLNSSALVEGDAQAPGVVATPMAPRASEGRRSEAEAKMRPRHMSTDTVALGRAGNRHQSAESIVRVSPSLTKSGTPPLPPFSSSFFRPLTPFLPPSLSLPSFFAGAHSGTTW